jgi:hypothetical protein
MAYKVEGDYFEACNCEVSCPCIYMKPGTEDFCDVFLAWHVSQGEKDGVTLDGLNVALAVHSPKLMTDGNWTVALYLDERATAEQGEALGAIFSGGAGGHLGNLAPLIGTVAGVNTAPITFVAENGARSVTVGDELEVRVESMPDEPTISDAPLAVVTQPLRQARSEKVAYRGTWRAEFSGRNAFITEFAYEG